MIDGFFNGISTGLAILLPLVLLMLVLLWLLTPLLLLRQNRLLAEIRDLLAEQTAQRNGAEPRAINASSDLPPDNAL